MRRHKIGLGRRLAIHARDGFRCLYCARDLWRARPREITVDHAVCHSQGGVRTAANLLTACYDCNFARGNRPLDEFADPDARARIARQLEQTVLDSAIAYALFSDQARP